MNSDFNLMDLPFDLYIRNIIIKQYIDLVRDKPKLDILDVGGKGGNIGPFLEGDKIDIVDILPAGDTLDNYIIGDAEQLPFKAGSYDVVICSDVYEHLSPLKRNKAISEMLRVSKNYLIIGAPFNSPVVYNAEILSNKFYYEITGNDNPWLKEHIKNVLPFENELELLITKMGYNFEKIGSVNISDWLLFQLVIAYSHRYNVFPEDFQKIYRFYNEHVWELRNLKESFYRKTYLFGKKGTVPILVDSCSTEHYDILRKEELYTLVFNSIKMGSESILSQFNDLNRTLIEKEKTLIEKEKTLIEKDKTLTEKEKYVRSLEETVSIQKAENDNLKDIAQNQSDNIESIKARINVIESDNQRLTQNLREINDSISWKMVKKVQKLFDSLMPFNSRRGAIYHLGLKSMRTQTSCGLETVLTRYSQQRRQKFVETKGNLDYYTWIKQNEPDSKALIAQRKQSKKIGIRPLISILTPVYNTPPLVLEEAIRSVIDQTYERWELCLVDGNSSKTQIRDILKKYADKDPRIKVKYLVSNDGISDNTNEALRLATGDYVALLDHDDLIAPFALFEIAKCINEDPLVDFIYSDKDMINEDGTNRFQPLFKPDWSPEMMLSANYLTHFCVIRKSIVDEIGGFVKATDGAQDWDIFLRVAERTSKFSHIPFVLYHWRTIDTSCAKNGERAKPYIFTSQRNALEGHIQRRGLKAILNHIPPGIWEIKWDIPEGLKASIIISSKNYDRLLKSIDTILKKTAYKNFEIIVAIQEGIETTKKLSLKELASDQRLKIITYNEPANICNIYNLAAKKAEGKVLTFFDDRNVPLTESWLNDLIGWATLPEIGIVGPKQVYNDNKILSIGSVLGSEGSLLHPFRDTYEQHYGPYGYTEWYRNLIVVNSSCMTIRKSLFEEAGCFNEALSAYGWDIDLCIRIWQKGYRNLYTPFAKMKYIIQDKVDNIDTKERLALYKLHKGLFDSGDPYYNVNLTLDNTTPSIKVLKK